MPRAAPAAPCDAVTLRGRAESLPGISRGSPAGATMLIFKETEKPETARGTCHRHLPWAVSSRPAWRGRSAPTRLRAAPTSPALRPRLRACKIWIPLHGIILPAARGGEPRLSALPPGPCRAASRLLSARTPKRHAAPESLLPSAGRALRHSRAKANGTPRPQRPRPFSRSSRDISRASAIASRIPRSVTPLPRPVARFAAKPSAAPLTLRTRPSALER